MPLADASAKPSSSARSRVTRSAAAALAAATLILTAPGMGSAASAPREPNFNGKPKLTAAKGDAGLVYAQVSYYCPKGGKYYLNIKLVQPHKTNPAADAMGVASISNINGDQRLVCDGNSRDSTIEVRTSSGFFRAGRDVDVFACFTKEYREDKPDQPYCGTDNWFISKLNYAPR